MDLSLDLDLIKNEFKTRKFQEKTMRIGNARYFGALIYWDYLDTRSKINVGCDYFVCLFVCVFDSWLFLFCLFIFVVTCLLLFLCLYVHSFVGSIVCFGCLFLHASFVIKLFQSVLLLSSARVRSCTFLCALSCLDWFLT